MFEESILENFTKYCSVEDLKTPIDKLEALIGEGLFFCENQLGGLSILNNSQMYLIGSIINNANIAQTDTIDVLIKINNSTILEQDINYLKLKTDKRRSEILSTKLIKDCLIYFLIQRLTNLSKVYYDNTSIIIKSQYELGKDFRIFIMASNSENSGECKALLHNGKNSFTFNTERYFKMIENKEQETNGSYNKMLCILKNLMAQLSIQINEYVLEDLLCNVSKELYEGTYNEQLLKIINYIKIKNKLEFENIISEDTGYKNQFYQTGILNINQVFQKLTNNLR